MIISKTRKTNTPWHQNPAVLELVSLSTLLPKNGLLKNHELRSKFQATQRRKTSKNTIMQLSTHPKIVAPVTDLSSLPHCSPLKSSRRRKRPITIEAEPRPRLRGRGAHRACARNRTRGGAGSSNYRSRQPARREHRSEARVIAVRARPRPRAFGRVRITNVRS